MTSLKDEVQKVLAQRTDIAGETFENLATDLTTICRSAIAERTTGYRWDPQSRTGKLDAHEVVELIDHLKAIQSRLKAGSQVLDPSSGLHLLLCDLEQHAATLALAEVRSAPRMAERITL